MSSVVQRAFAGGEISPALHARTDLVKYATGARTVRNFLIRREGGLSNRPGFRHATETRLSRTARLLRFQRASDDTYVMEFGEGYIRFLRSGAAVVVDVSPGAWATSTAYHVADLVTNDGVTYYCTTVHTSGSTTEPGTGTAWASSWYAMTTTDGVTPYEIPSPYLADDLRALQVSQSGDVVSIVAKGYPPKELRRYGHTFWTLTTAIFAPGVGTVTNLGATGGTSDTDDVIYAVTAVSDDTGEEGLPATVTLATKKPATGSPVALTWDGLAGAIEFDVYRSDDDGTTFGFIGVAGGTKSTETDSTFGTSTSSVTETFRGVLAEATTQVRNALALTLSSKATDGKYKFTGTIEVSGTNTGSYIWGAARAYYKRSTDTTRVLAATSLPQFTFDEAGTGSVVFSVTIDVPDDGYSGLTIDVVPVVRLGTGGSGAATGTCEVTGTKIEWSKTGTGFSDDGIGPDYSAAPPRDRRVFESGGAYPAAVGSYQQRRLYGGSTDQPERVWASKVALPANFLRYTPIGDDDPIIFTLAGAKVNQIRHFLDMDGLFILTSEQVYRIAGDADGVLTPTGVNPRALPFPGSSALAPLTVGAGALYVEARGTVVRSLVNDVAGSMQGGDLTIFAAHLFAGKQIVAWDYAQLPHSIVWAVRSDGTLLGLTYLKEQEIWGWHRHDTGAGDGAFEDCCVVSEGDEDVLYVIVRRTVGGATKRYIERMATRAVEDIRDGIFLDSALSYDGRNTSEVTLSLTGGADWTDEDSLTLTASAVDTFDVDDIGNEFVLSAENIDEDGEKFMDRLRLRVVGYSSTTTVTVRAVKTVPGPFRSLETVHWSRAVDTLAGLDHLEGKSVGVLADGAVVANPLDADSPAVVVEGGVVNLGACASVIHVGLPYVSDLETLDIDTPQGPSIKDRKMLVNRVGLYVERSSGIRAGAHAPTGDDPLAGLSLYEPRDALGDDRYDEPPPLLTEWINIPIPADWTSYGRVFIRQAEPLPLSILSVTPQGYIPVGG